MTDTLYIYLYESMNMYVNPWIRTQNTQMIDDDKFGKRGTNTFSLPQY